MITFKAWLEAARNRPEGVVAGTVLLCKALSEIELVFIDDSSYVWRRLNEEICESPTKYKWAALDVLDEYVPSTVELTNRIYATIPASEPMKEPECTCTTAQLGGPHNEPCLWGAWRKGL